MKRPLKLHKASAGSGKTYTLTYNYIKLLLGKKGDDGNYTLSQEKNRHRSTLAITFTNKATDEMKRRIVHQLALLAGIGKEKSPYEKELCRELSTTPTKLREHSLEALGQLLCDFSNFNVSTIDSFFQTVLRTFSREADITGNYGVELDDKFLTMLGINEMLSSVNRASDNDYKSNRRLTSLLAWLRQYITHKIEEGESFNIFNRKSTVVSDLATYAEKVLNETYKLNADIINSYLADNERLLAFASELNDAIHSEPARFFSKADAVIAELRESGTTAMMNATFTRSTFDIWETGAFGGKPGKMFTEVLQGGGIPYKKGANPLPEYDAMAKELVIDAGAVMQRTALLKLVRKSLFNLGLVGEIQRQIETLQADNNSIQLSATNDILRKIISEEEAPFIYERLGVRLHHFLIDEFQDTSRLQWINLSALVRESLSNGSDNLIIGDEKQSIYRFRNSDPDLIAKDVPEEFNDSVELHGTCPEENTNWRSSAEVVKFNNTAFKYLASATGLSEIYSNVVQQIAHPDLRGYVAAYPYESADESLETMARELARQLDSGYRQRDIAILVDTNLQGARVIDYLLNQKAVNPDLADLRILSDDSLKIAKSPAVNIVMSVLTFLDHVQSEPADESNPRRPIAAVQNRYHYYLSHGHDRLEAIRLASGTDDAPERLAAEAAEMNCLNLPSMVERVINRYLTEDVRREENVYLSGLMDCVVEFCDSPSGNGDLHSFIRWWEITGSARASLAIPSEVDAIRVMTIHKSKGLEFPCVHVPLVDFSLSNSRNFEWFSTRDEDKNPLPAFAGFTPGIVPPLIPLNTSSSLADTDFGPQMEKFSHKIAADSLNKTYVAFTRAATELIIGYKQVKTAGSLTVHSLLADAFSAVTPEWVATQPEASGLLESLRDKTDSDGVLRYGSPTAKTYSTSNENERPVIKMPPYEALDNDHIWDLSRIEDLEQMSLPRQKGIILHSIMSDVRTPDDVARSVLRHAMRGIVSADEIKAYTDELTDALNDLRVHEWFNGFTRLLNERAFFMSRKGSETFRRKPDRVVWRGDGIIDVIDFKFGEEEPKKYFKQVAGYVAALQRMWPGEKVRGYLWYPLQRRITPVIE